MHRPPTPLGALAALFCLALAACGRMGFEPGAVQGKLGAEPPSIGTDGGTASPVSEEPASPKGPQPDAIAWDDAGAEPTETADAGALPVDAAIAVEDGSTAEDGPTDAGTFSDASTEPTSDGAAPVTSFDCADFSDALHCSSFDDATGSDWDYVGATGGTVSIADGFLDAHTRSYPAEAFVEGSFSPMSGGTLYFQVRMALPGTSPLSSVNFLTIGNYDKLNDFGVELDAIDGNLAFYTMRDDFTVTGQALPRDRWFCLDGSLVLSDTAGEMHVRMDGVPALDVVGMDTLPRSGTDQANVGIDWTRAPQGEAHVRVDHFVIGTSALPCP